MMRSLMLRLYHRLIKTPTLLTITIGTVLVTYQALTDTLPVFVQLAFCGLMLVIAGIPHGALDHLVEQERAVRLNKPFSLPWFIAKYLLTMGIYAGAWFLAPTPCLLVFLLISAWHFGETDLNDAPQTPYWSLARLLAGGFIISFILLSHPIETTPILIRLVHQNSLIIQVWQFAVERSGAILRGWSTLLVVLIMLAYSHHPVHISTWRMARLSLIILLTLFLPLLPSFMLYFGGWHALSAFNTLHTYLPANTTKASQAIWKIWQQSMPLTLLSLLFLGSYILLWNFAFPNFDPLPTLFIFLSLITLPHISVMHRIQKV